ncbi:MAG: RnfABCDGE type electron transport complex subunit B [Gammaproteobacteria bacterium]|nr:RnfABCDGE type electron transport complex subunit B [Gammaproteobacteria bacterium]MDH3411695.1 RnfABCDGE type electron transport complex subunit B [Gammaproteobacteria bacterium]
MNQSLVDQIDALLPQTQCTRCGYEDCRAYAQAVADGKCNINRCPPGGMSTIGRLAAMLGRTPLPLDPECGRESERLVALVDEGWCIGCRLCIEACPVDAIVGAPKRMHTVIEAECTGCELCVAPCPVDCIRMVQAKPGPESAEDWLETRAHQARQRYEFRKHRLDNEARPRAKRGRRGSAPTLLQRKFEIDAAIERVQNRRAAGWPGSSG